MQAIETVYNGIKFRSRLEARWAVYFDVIGLKWEYEAQGYSLSNGKWYLPDFYFPMGWGGSNAKFEFAEVKPLCYDDDDRRIGDVDLSPVEQFWRERQSLILLDGPPSLHHYFGQSTQFAKETPRQILDFTFCAHEGNYIGDDAESSDWFICCGWNRGGHKTEGKFGDIVKRAVWLANNERF